MANPTTNYGFILPTSTDLVTDLPADFDVALQGVDTQMLTNANAAIAKTIVDAKGDIIAATAADTVSRLAIGANDTILTADSAQATGMKWAAAAASGGMTSIATGSLSGASTSISSIAGTFKSLQLIIVGWYASNVDATISFNSDTSSNYQQALVKSADNTISTSGGSATKIYLHNQGGSTSNATAVAVLDIHDYSNASFGKIWNLNNYYVASNNSTKVFEMQAGCFVSNTAITSIQMTTPGTWSGGTFILYGVK